MLLNIPNFSITKSVVPNYMDGVLLGVVKTLLFLWFEAVEHQVYYQEYKKYLAYCIAHEVGYNFIFQLIRLFLNFTIFKVTKF